MDADSVVKLFASKFIARHDIKAIQRRNGDYNPVNSKITRQDLLDHLAGTYTYGHYLLNTNSQCKLLAFDIDLEPTGLLPTIIAENGWWANFVPGNPREVWRTRSNQVERAFLKYQLRSLAEKLARLVRDLLEVPCAIAYTGTKGLHVYGFTGLMDAKDVRYAAEIVIEEYGKLEPYRGNHFFRHKLEIDERRAQDPYLSYDQLAVEVFPKQTDMSNKTHGNLMRLPLGRNLKNPKDPTFFLDLRSNFGENCFSPRDPVEVLNLHDPWA